MTDLTFVTDDELWEELRNRQDAAIFVWLKKDRVKLESSGMSYKGGKFICLGLTEALASQLKEIISKNYQDVQDAGGSDVA